MNIKYRHKLSRSKAAAEQDIIKSGVCFDKKRDLRRTHRRQKLDILFIITAPEIYESRFILMQCAVMPTPCSSSIFFVR
jgi:hypothetical protein